MKLKKGTVYFKSGRDWKKAAADLLSMGI